ncbi:mitochondrial glutathione transporter SLC25A39 isoform X1 [Phaenicophaeus curvirostris]|uniref:mitochondrial glutathione transporter SLC25A39 isoform X1 n=1 Tax=Phaenicophaeus curvirostris TaxID=33595 RepID=UPI0037F0F10A
MVCAVPGSPLPTRELGGEAQPAHSWPCCLCAGPHAATCGSYRAGETLWALPLQSTPLPVRVAGWGWSQGTGLVTTGSAWEVPAGPFSPLHPGNSPTARLRAHTHVCASAWGGGTSPVLSLSVSPLCISVFPAWSVPWGSQQASWKCFLYCNGLMDHLYVCQNGNGCTAWYKAPTRFTGTLDAFVKITRYEGIRSLWSGLPPTLVMAVPATVIYFTTYDQLRDYLHARTGSRGPHIPLLAGALARLGAVTLISPLELIRTKMQSRQLSYRELGLCIQSAVAQGGWLSLWRGWGPTVLRDVPFSALYWFNYELVRQWLCGWARLEEASFMISFASGAISGTVAAVLTLPFDVVKTQRQIELGDSEVHPVTTSKPSSTWLLMQRIRAESGTRGLFAGFLPRVIKVAPACAIMISTYEFGKTFFQKLNQDQRLRAL